MDAGATVIVKATVLPFPLNVSVRKVDVIGALPMYDTVSLSEIVFSPLQ